MVGVIASEKVHSSGSPQVVSASLPPASSYRPQAAPSSPHPAQSNLDLSNSQRSVPYPLCSDTLVRAHTEDRRSPGPPASVKLSARELPKSSAADPATESQDTVTVNSPPVLERVPRILTMPQRQGAAIASLAKFAFSAPRLKCRVTDEDFFECVIFHVRFTRLIDNNNPA